MTPMNLSDFIEKANYYGGNGIPFLFIVDFEISAPHIYTLSSLCGRDDLDIKYCIDGLSGELRDYKSAEPSEYAGKIKLFNLQKFPISYEFYKKAFDNVRKNQEEGNSYLLNLTFKTPININLALPEIFYKSKSKYKLYFKNGKTEFVSFSPETFLNIIGGKIYTYPVKGTIDAAIPDAKKILLNDGKERAEHLTVVDLLRNDLNIVCNAVKVNKFFSAERVRTNEGDLFQTFSEIEGAIKPRFINRLGDILSNLLPAGSVCGAPKPKTLEIIKETELEKRGYYTGVFGIYDGNDLKSSVLIRFIEKTAGNFYYRSGGGITVYSDPAKEYNEMIKKIYVPVY